MSRIWRRFVVVFILLAGSLFINLLIDSHAKSENACPLEGMAGLEREQRLLGCATESAIRDHYDEAIAYTKEALEIVEGVPDRNIHNVAKDFYVAILLKNLGFLYYAKGDYERALDYYTRKREADIEGYRKIGLEPDNGNPPVEFAEDLFHIGLAYAAQKKNSEAINFFEKANAKEDETLTDDFFAELPEQQKLQYVDVLRYLTDTTISLQDKFTPPDRELTRLALRTIIRRKGRVLDLLSSDMSNVRSRLIASDRVEFDKYIALRQQRRTLISTLGRATNPRDQLDKIHALERELKIREDQLHERVSYLYHTWSLETVEAIQTAIPSDSVLVEFIRYRPFNVNATLNGDRWQESHYGAFVVHHTSDPQYVDLGPARAIDDKVLALRAAIESTNGSIEKTRQIARTADELIMKPLRPLIGSLSGVLYLAPDGVLNLLPYAALVDENGHYLVERTTIDFLTSGRDLLRAAVRSKQRTSNPLILADPDFNEPGIGPVRSHMLGATDTPNTLCVAEEFTNGGWSDLEGFLQEGKAVRRLVKGARLLTGQAASEETLKRVHAPAILHIATHGEFLEIPAPSPRTNDERDVWFKLRFPVTGHFDPNAPQPENMLLRSYIALAGANLQRGEESPANCNEGILTALELSRIDLFGTRLVVLSACQTGLGEIANGEGVYGLRRALVIAGSESQLITLWSIDDQATVQLITTYYRFLRRGTPRGESLRQAQLTFIKNHEHADPFFWAAFIPSGLSTGLTY